MRWLMLLVCGLCFGGCLSSTGPTQAEEESQAFWQEVGNQEGPSLDLSHYNRVEIRADYFHCEYSTGGSSELCNFSWQADGAFDGTTFRAVGRTSDDTRTVITEIAVAVDFERLVVEDFSASYRLDGADTVTTYGIQGQEVQLWRINRGLFQLEFDVRGVQVRERVKALSHNVEFSDWGMTDYRLSNFACGKLSNIKVYLYSAP